MPKNAELTHSARSTNATNGRNRRTIRNVPDAIAVKPGTGATFEDVLRSVRQKVNVDEIGARITSITESRNGEVLFRLPRGDKKKKELEETLRTVLGHSAEVRELVKNVEIEISDLDGVTTEKEVENSLRIAMGLPIDDKTVKVSSLRYFYGGTKHTDKKDKLALVNISN